MPMKNIKELSKTIFQHIDPSDITVNNLLNQYQHLSREQKKEFINRFFNEKIYYTDIIDKQGTLIVFLRQQELIQGDPCHVSN